MGLDLAQTVQQAKEKIGGAVEQLVGANQTDNGQLSW